MPVPALWRWLFAICISAMVMALSLVPGEPEPGDSAFIWAVADTPKALQKSMHIVAYGCLVLAWSWALDPGRKRALVSLAVILSAVGFGIFMEYLQLSVPGRFGTLFDIGLNTIGVVLAAIVLYTTNRGIGASADRQ